MQAVSRQQEAAVTVCWVRKDPKVTRRAARSMMISTKHASVLKYFLREIFIELFPVVADKEIEKLT